MVFMLFFLHVHAPNHIFFCMLIEIAVSIVIIYVKIWFNSCYFLLIKNCNLVY